MGLVPKYMSKRSNPLFLPSLSEWWFSWMCHVRYYNPIKSSNTLEPSLSKYEETITVFKDLKVFRGNVK